MNESKARFAARAARAGPRAEIPDLVHTYVFEVPAETDIAKMALEYAANPSVEYAVPDHAARTQALPDDPYLQSSGAWGQAYGDLWALGTIGAPAAWDVATGVGVVVAVVDTGLDYNHPDIVGNVWPIRPSPTALRAWTTTGTDTWTTYGDGTSPTATPTRSTGRARRGDGTSRGPSRRWGTTAWA